MEELNLKKKFTFKVKNKKIVLIKKSHESFFHVAAKILCYALYQPYYPDIKIEVKIGERYKPDLVMLDNRKKPVFWGECGSVGKEKIYKILHKFPETHFSFIKISKDAEQFKEMVADQKEKASHSGRIDIVVFPENIVDNLSNRLLSKIKLKNHLSYSL